MKKQVICLSTTPWHAHPTRKQQVMSRLSDCEILYFDPPITVIAPLKDKSMKPRMTEWKQGGERVAENITRYSLPPVLPFYNKYRFFNRRNGKKVAKFVAEIAKKHGFENPVLWVYHPSNVDSVDRIPHSALVYDCVDRHSQYPGLINPALVDGMEAELASKCSAVFATAKGLYDTLSKSCEHTWMIPNGGNYDLFSKADGKLEVPADIADIKTPILGFVGALQQCIDRELAAEVARRRPDWTLVFIGAPLAGVDVSMLEALPNVRMLGRREHETLPAYISRFDVCLNLFDAGGLAKDVSPLKFYEYLATGKPVVTTPMPLQVRDFADAVYIADGADEFIAACERAMAEHDRAMTERRMEYGRTCSWDGRVAEIREKLATLDILK